MLFLDRTTYIANSMRAIKYLCKTLSKNNISIAKVTPFDCFQTDKAVKKFTSYEIFNS